MSERENIDWTELFGSDEEEQEERLPIKTFGAIPGLKLIQQGLTHQQQMELTNALISHNYFSGPNVNQAMLFGELPDYLQWIETWVIEKYPELFDNDDVILHRSPLFDQAILNMYKKGEGILNHVDLLRFQDGILIISLLSSCVMKMQPVNNLSNEIIDILLRPGDVLALSKEARYQWKHGIEETSMDVYHGDLIERGTRISVTLRKMNRIPEDSYIQTSTRY